MSSINVKTFLNSSMLAGLQRKRTNRVVLLTSGGVESTAAGIILAQTVQVYPLFVNYGQRAAAAELYAINRIAERLGFSELCVYDEPNILQLGHGFNGGDDVTTDTNAWVPGRNTLLMVLAGIYGVKIDADGLAIGYCLDDNFVFGDNDFSHHQLMAVTLTRSFARPFDVLLPLSAMSKTEAVALLKGYGVLDLTVSCWNAQQTDGSIKVCDQCANCTERQRAIKEVTKHE